jgi:NAD(P)H-nitrite reductase large subunit
MASKKKHLIIGCGPAALSAVDAIRRVSNEDEITVVSKQDSPPYSPAVLPYVLSRRADESALFARDEDYFRKMAVTFFRGREAVCILPVEKRVVCRSRDTEQYDTLLIASGAEPIPQPVHGSHEDNLLTFHTYGDYRRLRDRIKDGCDVTILGAGMVAVEVAIALAERGCAVRIIGRGRPLRAYFDEEAGAYIRQTLIDGGIQIVTGKNITQVERSQEGLRIACADGEVFETGVVVSCLGVRPDLGLARASGISTGRGILVDGHMRTNVEGVYAAGDVTESPSFQNGVPGLCAILPEAIAQGKVAGANMAGKETDYEGWIPMNLLKFFGHSAFSIGAVMPEAGAGEVLENKNEETSRFERLVFRDGKLSGAMFVNFDIDPGVFQYLMRKQVSIAAHKQNLLEQPAEVSRWLMMRTERGLSSD